MAVPVIIEAAINGATSKRRNPNVPISTDELIADAIACLDAGAAIIHFHIAASGLSGEESAAEYLAVAEPVLAARPEALWYPTINFGPPERRYAHIEPLAASGSLRMTLGDPGSVNLGGSRDGVPTGSFAYVNTFDEIAEQMRLGRELGLGPSIAVYEPGFLRAVVAYHRAGRLPTGAFVKLYLCADRGLSGSPFGLPPTLAALDAYLELLDGTGLAWAVSAVGDDLTRTPVCAAALERGGHLHIGLEFYAGGRTPTNAMLVEEAVAACGVAGRTPASSVEAARILGLAKSVPPEAGVPVS